MTNNTVFERTQAILAQAAKVKEQRVLATLDTPVGQHEVLKLEDRKLLRSIKDRISDAYNKPLISGFMFEEAVEDIVAIARALQYAKKEVRELLEPSNTTSLDLYDLFDRDLRDEIIESYGQLPYDRQPTPLHMPDGSVKILDQDIVDEARIGKPANVERLNNALKVVNIRLGLYNEYKATEARATAEFTRASRKVTAINDLVEYNSQLPE